MKLTWKDVVTTLATGAAVALYVAFMRNVDLPVVGGVRSMAIAVLLLGIVGCSFSNAQEVMGDHIAVGWRGTYRTFFGVVGAVAIAAFVLALIMASETMLTILVVSIAAMWLVTTARHAFEPESTKVNEHATR